MYRVLGAWMSLTRHPDLRSPDWRNHPAQNVIRNVLTGPQSPPSSSTFVPQHPAPVESDTWLRITGDRPGPPGSPLVSSHRAGAGSAGGR